MAIPGIKPRPMLPRLLLAGAAVAIGIGTAATIAMRTQPVVVAPAPLTSAPAVVAAPLQPIVPAPAVPAPPPAAVLAVRPAPAAAVPAAPPAPAFVTLSPTPIPAAPPAAPPAAALAPSFDIVRVSPQGSAVIAGRAEPGAEITVFDGTRPVARARADRRGEFVALPSTPLAEGGRELTLAARGADGPERRSDGAVLVVVPPQPAAAAAPAPTAAAAPQPAPSPVAVLVPSAGPPRILQEQRRLTPVSLDVVDYTESGSIRFTGASAPNAALRIYVDNAHAGDARGDPAGRWVLSPDIPVAPGIHTLRLDELDATGRVLSRIELPFQRAAPAIAESTGRVVVQPGQNLWRLARTAYGTGVRYTVIFLANRDQIRNPALIYPGQAFTVPTSQP